MRCSRVRSNTTWTLVAAEFPPPSPPPSPTTSWRPARGRSPSSIRYVHDVGGKGGFFSISASFRSVLRSLCCKSPGGQCAFGCILMQSLKSIV
jgi:hypothetical protein